MANQTPFTITDGQTDQAGKVSDMSSEPLVNQLDMSDFGNLIKDKKGSEDLTQQNLPGLSIEGDKESQVKEGDKGAPSSESDGKKHPSKELQKLQGNEESNEAKKDVDKESEQEPQKSPKKDVPKDVKEPQNLPKKDIDKVPQELGSKTDNTVNNEADSDKQDLPTKEDASSEKQTESKQEPQKTLPSENESSEPTKAPKAEVPEELSFLPGEDRQDDVQPDKDVEDPRNLLLS